MVAPKRQTTKRLIGLFCNTIAYQALTQLREKNYLKYACNDTKGYMP